MASTLVLLTLSYPYHRAAEQTFLDPEIPHLARAFDRLIVVPGEVGGERSEMPEGVLLDDSLSGHGSRGGWRRVIRSALSSSWVYDEAIRRAEKIRNLVGLRRLLAFANDARGVREWLYRFVVEGHIDTGRTVFYTYWLDYRTMGVVLAKRQFPQLRVVSRAHGYDLYEETQRPPYLPGRRRLLASLDRLFLGSEAGRRYLSARFPGLHGPLAVSRLGTFDPDVRSAPSFDGIFRVVSCSNLVPIKRVDRLVQGLAHAARERPAAWIQWDHFGGGPLQEELRSLASRLAPGNLQWRLAGTVANSVVTAFYRERPVDLFVNTSESEGMPVAIMEALGHSIPVLAPAIGGIPEIVDSESGMLLGPAPDAKDVGAALLELMDDRSGRERRRAEARRRWEIHCNAERNYAAFASGLLELIP
jgi:colanic acid/amylovoran biosynthesis glycosyltransferase